MKFRFYNQNLEMELYPNKINHLVIEEPITFGDFVQSVYSTSLKISDEIAILNSEYEVIDFAKKVQVIYSVLDLKFEQRDLQKQLLSHVITSIENSPLIEEYLEIRSRILMFFNKLNTISDYDISLEDELPLEFFLKSNKIKLEEPSGRFANRLFEYTKTLHRLIGKKIFIIIGSQYFLSNQDFSDLLKFIQYEDVIFLFVDGQQFPQLNLLVNEYIIDRDLCLIY